MSNAGRQIRVVPADEHFGDHQTRHHTSDATATNVSLMLIVIIVILLIFLRMIVITDNNKILMVFVVVVIIIIRIVV